MENIRSYEKEEVNFEDGSLLLSGDVQPNNERSYYEFCNFSFDTLDVSSVSSSNDLSSCEYETIEEDLDEE